MSIYTRWGSKVKILKTHGAHQTKHMKYPSVLALCEVTYEDTGEVKNRYEFVFSLRADNGINEIDSACLNATTELLDKRALSRAIAEAE